MQAIASEPKAATVPDGLHHRRGVEYLAAGPSLPAGVTPLSSEELEARAERIAARNARLREELAGRKVRATNPDRRGFCLPEEAEA